VTAREDGSSMSSLFCTFLIDPDLNNSDRHRYQTLVTSYTACLVVIMGVDDVMVWLNLLSKKMLIII
jgi:hypothetical protein